MSVSAAALSSEETARIAAGKPILSALNALSTYVVAHEWSTVGTWSGSTDDVDASYPTSRVCDAIAHLDTRPDSSVVASTVYLLCQLSGAYDFDLASVFGHNIGTAGGTLQIQVADDQDYSSNLETVASWTPADDSRLLELELSHSTVSSGAAPARLSGVEFLRFRFSNMSVLPQVSEIFLGRRRQLERYPDEPWDPEHEQSLVYDFTADAGGTTRNVFASGVRDLSPSWTQVSAAEKTLLRQWWSDCGRGTKPGLFIPDTSAPEALWMLPPPSFGQPFTGPASHSARLRLIEQPPYIAEE